MDLSVYSLFAIRKPELPSYLALIDGLSTEGMWMFARQKVSPETCSIAVSCQGKCSICFCEFWCCTRKLLFLRTQPLPRGCISQAFLQPCREEYQRQTFLPQAEPINENQNLNHLCKIVLGGMGT